MNTVKEAIFLQYGSTAPLTALRMEQQNAMWDAVMVRAHATYSPATFEVRRLSHGGRVRWAERGCAELQVGGGRDLAAGAEARADSAHGAGQRGGCASADFRNRPRRSAPHRPPLPCARR